MVARMARANRVRLRAVGFVVLQIGTTGGFAKDPEREAQDNHERGGREDEQEPRHITIVIAPRPSQQWVDGPATERRRRGDYTR